LYREVTGRSAFARDPLHSIRGRAQVRSYI
jgi:hypothetical protein